MTVTNLHLEEIKEFQIPLPSYAEQHHIAEILTTTDPYIEKEQTYLTKPPQIKKAWCKTSLQAKSV